MLQPEAGSKSVNLIKDEQFQRLREAFAGGASLREACAYAGVAKNTALRYRLLLGIAPNSQDSWNRKRFVPSHASQRLSPD